MRWVLLENGNRAMGAWAHSYVLGDEAWISPRRRYLEHKVIVTTDAQDTLIAIVTRRPPAPLLEAR